jgi:hypothetical protein
MDTFLSLVFRSVLKTPRGIVPESLLFLRQRRADLVMLDSRPHAEGIVRHLLNGGVGEEKPE